MRGEQRDAVLGRPGQPDRSRSGHRLDQHVADPAADVRRPGCISARTFGEAQINFDALAGDDECVAFGCAYLKSRSSDSFTAAMKDFIAPLAAELQPDAGDPRHQADDADPAGAARRGRVRPASRTTRRSVARPGAEDAVVDSCTTVAGVCDFTAVQQGEYWVVETVAPTGHDLAARPFQPVTVTADEEVNVTFVDPRQRGAILLTKTAKHAAATGGVSPQEGVTSPSLVRRSTPTPTARPASMGCCSATTTWWRRFRPVRRRG